MGKKRSGSTIYCYTIVDDVVLSLINPIANLLPDKVEICPGGNQKIGIAAGAVGRQVLWSNGSTADSIEITTTDSLVWVEIKVRKDCPPIRDSIQVVQKEINSNLWRMKYPSVRADLRP